MYMMSLKDDNGLIKMYAMVDAENYQKVATISSDEGFDTLRKKFIGSEVEEDDEDQQIEKDITIDSIQWMNVDGKSKCFIQDSKGNSYKMTITAKNEDILAFLKKGDAVHIYYVEGDEVHLIKKIEHK